MGKQKEKALEAYIPIFQMLANGREIIEEDGCKGPPEFPAERSPRDEIVTSVMAVCKLSLKDSVPDCSCMMMGALDRLMGEMLIAMPGWLSGDALFIDWIYDHGLDRSDVQGFYNDEPTDNLLCNGSERVRGANPARLLCLYLSFLHASIRRWRHHCESRNKALAMISYFATVIGSVRRLRLSGK